jgi:long-chain acyl-CoA synthetase
MPSSPLAEFLKRETKTPDKVFLRQPLNGVWKEWTWAQAGNQARRIAKGLHAMGMTEGTHVALLSKNCAEWIISDLAIMMAGCVSIPVYPTLSSSSIKSILVHSDSKAIFIGKLDDYAEQSEGIPAGMKRISFENYGIKEEYTLEQLVNNNEPLDAVHNWNRQEIMTIIYTSGTTGLSKGVMHTAEAFDATITAAMPQLEISTNPNLFSYLPLSHVAERLGIEMSVYYKGGTVSFAESLDTFSKNLAEVQPHVFFAVPRIWGKIREGILKKVSQKKLDLLLIVPVINSLLKKSIKKKLGFANTTHFFSAAAPISVELLEWYQKLDIVIYQVYGMTEDCVYAHFSGPKANKFGAVGKPLPGLQVKIAEDGEIRVKSPGNMVGYYKEPAMTTGSFDEDGYYKTGDMGKYDAEGFLRITGRVKDIFKTDKGKYISPAPVEVKLLTNADIEHVCVVGTGVPQPIALLCLSDTGKMKMQSDLVKSLSDTLAAINPFLEKYERLEKMVIMKDRWTIANGLITPSLKVKRNEVEKLHLPKYPEWYCQESLVVWE